MKLKERLKVLENLLSVKGTQLGNVEIARQTLAKELIGLEANIKLLKEMIREEDNKSQKPEKLETKTPIKKD